MRTEQRGIRLAVGHDASEMVFVMWRGKEGGRHRQLAARLISDTTLACTYSAQPLAGSSGSEIFRPAALRDQQRAVTDSVMSRDGGSLG